MTVTTIIARPGESIKGEGTGACSCVVEGGKAVERCGEAARLWDELVAARDALRGDEKRRSGWRVGHKVRRDRFAAARAEYHEHLGRAR